MAAGSLSEAVALADAQAKGEGEREEEEGAASEEMAEEAAVAEGPVAPVLEDASAELVGPELAVVDAELGGSSGGSIAGAGDGAGLDPASLPPPPVAAERELDEVAAEIAAHNREQGQIDLQHRGLDEVQARIDVEDEALSTQEQLVSADQDALSTEHAELDAREENQAQLGEDLEAQEERGAETAGQGQSAASSVMMIVRGAIDLITYISAGPFGLIILSVQSARSIQGANDDSTAAGEVVEEEAQEAQGENEQMQEQTAEAREQTALAEAQVAERGSLIAEDRASNAEAQAIHDEARELGSSRQVEAEDEKSEAQQRYDALIEEMLAWVEQHRQARMAGGAGAGAGAGPGGGAGAAPAGADAASDATIARASSEDLSGHEGADDGGETQAPAPSEVEGEQDVAEAPAEGGDLAADGEVEAPEEQDAEVSVDAGAADLDAAPPDAAEPSDGPAPTPMPSLADLAASRLAPYGDERAWREAWDAQVAAAGVDGGVEPDMDTMALLATAYVDGFSEGLGEGITQSMLSLALRPLAIGVGKNGRISGGMGGGAGFKGANFAGGFLAMAEIGLVGPEAWWDGQMEGTIGLGKEGVDKLFGPDGDFVTRLQGVLDILDAVNNAIGLLYTILAIGGAICFSLWAVFQAIGCIPYMQWAIPVAQFFLQAANIITNVADILGTLNSVIGSMLLGLRYVLIAARTIQMVADDADPETQAARAAELQEALSGTIGETTQRAAHGLTPATPGSLDKELPGIGTKPTTGSWTPTRPSASSSGGAGGTTLGGHRPTPWQAGTTPTGAPTGPTAGDHRTWQAGATPTGAQAGPTAGGHRPTGWQNGAAPDADPAGPTAGAHRPTGWQAGTRPEGERPATGPTAGGHRVDQGPAEPRPSAASRAWGMVDIWSSYEMASGMAEAMLNLAANPESFWQTEEEEGEEEGEGSGNGPLTSATEDLPDVPVEEEGRLEALRAAIWAIDHEELQLQGMQEGFTAAQSQILWERELLAAKERITAANAEALAANEAELQQKEIAQAEAVVAAQDTSAEGAEAQERSRDLGGALSMFITGFMGLLGIVPVEAGITGGDTGTIETGATDGAAAATETDAAVGEGLGHLDTISAEIAAAREQNQGAGDLNAEVQGLIDADRGLSQQQEAATAEATGTVDGRLSDIRADRAAAATLFDETIARMLTWAGEHEAARNGE